MTGMAAGCGCMCERREMWMRGPEEPEMDAAVGEGGHEEFMCEAEEGWDASRMPGDEESMNPAARALAGPGLVAGAGR